jgi:hypothetical protein
MHDWLNRMQVDRNMLTALAANAAAHEAYATW